MVNYHNDHRVCVDMRRVGCWYLKKSAGTRQFKEIMSRITNVNEIEDLIRHFPLGEIQEPQVEQE